jgi:hypothetical protein
VARQFLLKWVVCQVQQQQPINWKINGWRIFELILNDFIHFQCSMRWLAIWLWWGAAAAWMDGWSKESKNAVSYCGSYPFFFEKRSDVICIIFIQWYLNDVVS